MELPSIGIFCLDLSLNQIIIIPWQYQNLNFESKLLQLKNFLNKEIGINQMFILKAGLKFVEPNSNQLDVLNKIKNYKVDVDEQWSRRILKLKELLINAVHERISSQPKFCKNCVNEKLECNHSLVGVLFSGGVDCAVLALLAGKLLGDNRSIDLINVSFDEANQYKSPDRITGLETLEELKTIYPDRKWNFLEVNVTQKELDKARQERIADLIYPLQSILDDSLGCALWFASRARQTTSNGEIVSPCRAWAQMSYSVVIPDIELHSKNIHGKVYMTC
ncbi:hypothetical protein NQ317_001774 [Molorchus minor]|uniref:Asparagine synthetase domain-containing protein n=1 Tax=Molorchus minor TaxID=1323400 RepID=A0ABQ9JGZ9_9CUCU|nr:hypothetical protein NQ317_001774 [Molorchus minor]